MNAAGRFARIERRRRGVWPALIAAAAVVAVALWPKAEAAAPALGAWAFWSLAASAFVTAFTTFDQWFRDPALRAVQLAAPFPPEAELAGRGGVILARHLPLAGLAAVAGVGLAGDRWLVAGPAVALAAALHAALSTALHVVIGKSLVSGRSALKDWLSQGLGPPEAALLFYGPAGAFVLGLAQAVGVELGLRAWLARGDLGLLWGALAASAVAAALLAREALAIQRAHGAAIAARFYEFEILPPWREDGLPRRLWGERLAAWAGPARPIFVRDLKQYRRRHRVVPPLVAVAALVGLLAGRVAPGAACASVLALCALFLWPRATLGAAGPRGFGGAPELYRDRALPLPPEWERRSAWLLTIADQGPPALALLAGVALGHPASLGWAALAAAGLAGAAALPSAVGRAAVLALAIGLGGVA